MCATPARHRAQRQGVVPEAGFWAAKDLLELTAQGRSGKHARKGTSKYTLHIGRVGALAVSLGVGLAVANAGVAYADSDTDSSVSESQADDSAAPPSSPQVDATDQTGVDNDEEPGTADDVDDEEVGEDLAPEEADPSANEDTDVDSDEELPGSSGGSGESPGGSDSTPDEQQAADPDVTAPDSEQVDSSPDETVVSTPEDDEAEEGPALDDAHPQGDVAVVDVVNTTTEPVERASATPSESVETVDIVTALVSTVVSPFASPDAPAQVPWFDALLAWVRRQITHTFFNKTPVYGPITVEQIFTGQLFIDLNATDPNGDPLTYEIIQPTHGVVVRDVITGNFIYTPTTIVTGEPLQDTFQVVIRDDSEHLTGALGSFQKLLHGVARLFGLAQRDNITVTIPVTIDPLVQLPPTVVTAGLPIFKLGDSPVKVLSSAIIADADSDQISQATIRISTAGQDGDVLNYVAPDGSPITATWDVTTKTLTLSGLATAEQYEQALLAVTFSTTKGGLPRGVSISVTDETGVQSLVPGAAIVTVIGLPPTVTVFGLPIFKLGGSPVKVVSSVTLGDLDSENLSEATIVIATAYQEGDVLSYVAPSGNPITASWDAATRTLTLSGVASLDQYEEAIKAVSFSATEGGLSRGISFSVTDDAGVQSLVPGAAIVNVIGLPPTVTVFGIPIFKLGGSPVKVVSSVTLGDLDSENLSEATIVIATAYQDGDVLSYTAPAGNPITASWDAATRTLTLSGVATLDQYEEAIKAVTFSATEGGLSRGISFSVTDDAGVQSLVPGAAVVSVIGLPPTVTVFGIPIFKLGGAPVKVVSSVTLGDLDSENLSEATIVIATAYQDGDVLSYTAPSGNPITASWDAATRTLTLSGVASLDQYEEAIKAVSFSATEGGLSRGISFSVTDEAGVQSLVPGAAVVSVIGLPPTVTVFGIPIFKLGGSPVKVVSSVTLGDLDSENLSEATIVIASAYQDGDVLSYVAPSGNPITASWDAATRTLTLSGVATLDQYEEAIKAVTFSATEGGLSRGISFSVTDEAGVQSLVPGAAVVSVIGLPPTVTVFGIPIFKLGGAPVKVVSSVTLGDLDSDNLSEATIVIATAYQDGDVLSYIAPSGNPITASWDAATRTLTLSGVATLDQYEEAIKAVTFSATEGGLSRGISFSVTDDAGVQSLVPGAAVVSVIGLPPTVTVFGIPIFKLGGSPVKVVSSVTLGDLDSENLSEATIVIATAYQDGDVLSYTAPSGNPITASWDAATRTLTLSGVATLDQYEEAIKAVTFSATEGGLSRGISFSVTDDAGVQSLVPGAAVVSVIGLPPTVTVFGIPIFKLGGSPVKVVSSVTLGDLDSDNLSEATIVIASAYQDGDVLSYTAPSGNPITASWDAATRTLTLSGVASLDQYEEAIKAVSFSATEGGLSRGISFSVTDDAGVQSLVPGAAVVSVIGLPPTVTVFGIPIFKLGGSPVKVVSSVTLGDLDSDNLSEATIVIASAYQDGDVLSYTAPSGNPITASWDAATRTLTLSGVATLDQYEEAIKAVTFSTTEGGVARGISVSVTDDAQVQSLVPGAAIVSVIGLPPTVTVFGIPIFKLGGSPVKVVSSVTLGDLDSDNLSEATIVIASAYQDGDVLSYTAPSGNPITASWDAATRTLTLSGVASLDQYEEAIKAVSFSATEGGLSRGISFSVTDDAGVQSLVPGAAVVSVIGLPPTVTVFGIPIFKLGGSPVKVVSSVTLGDLDSDNLSEATIVIASAYQDGDVLSYTAPSGNPITASWDAATRTLTLSGVASLDQYEEAIKAVTFSTTEGGVARGISVSVTDDAQVQSLVPGAAIVSVIGLPPTVTVFGIPIFKLGGSPVKVVSSVTLGDLDSDNLSEATIVIASAYQDGDVLSYTAPSGNPITASWDAATRTLTLSGVASLDQYEEAIKAVTFSTTEGGVARGISVSVTDDAQVQSLVPGAAIVNVIGLPPTVTVFGTPIFKLGGAPVKVVSSVTLGDLDSENLTEATLVISSAYQTGDVLSYTAPSGNPITASWDAATRTLTLSGVATLDQYEEAIKAVTFSTTEGGIARGISVSVTDDAQVQSLVPGAAIVSVIGLPPTVTVFGTPIFKLGGAPVNVVSSVTLGDLDSDNLSEATIVIASAYQDGDVLSYVAPSGNPITASWDAATRTLTLSGVASLDQYEEAIKAVTFSTTEGGLARGVSVSVIDDAGVQSLVPGAAIVNVIGLPPTVTVFGTPIFKLGGAPVKVVSSVTLGDLDSENLTEATLVISSAYQTGDVLSYTAPSGNPITASWDAATRTLTLSGVATLDQYEEAIKAVTFSTTEGGIARGISVSVTDDAQVQSLVPGAAIVNVIGLPPTVTVFGTPIFKLGGSPVKVVSSVSLGDLDSDNLSEATIVVATAYQDGDVLSYTAPSGNPITASWDAATRTLTLSGVATLDQYEEAIKAVTFTTNQGGLSRGIQIHVTDDSAVKSLVPGSAIVTVVGLPPSVATIGAPTYTIGTAPVKLIASASIADADSDNMSKATVTIATLGQDGDVLGYIAPSGNPITASWNAATRTLTLAGVATKAQYEEALEAVTFSATGGALLVRGISITVTDDTNVDSLLPGAATANVRYSLQPSVVTVGTPTHTIGTAPVTLLSSATITDADSDMFSSARVTIETLGQSGDVLGYVQPSGNPITATWDAGSKTLTLTGIGTKAQYEEALEAVTFSATGGILFVRGISVSVSDDTGVSSSGLLNGLATATVRENSAPGLWITGGKSYDRNDPPMNPVVTLDISDDLGYLSGATLKVTSFVQSNDTLGYVQPSGNPVTASWDSGSKTLTLSGTATVEQYEQALRAVTFWANQGGWTTRTIAVTVTDNGGKSASGSMTVSVW